VSDVAALERSIELVANELRDLNRWLRKDQAEQLKSMAETQRLIYDELGTLSREHAETRASVAELRVEVDELRTKVSALEQEAAQRKATS
jgi:hypothetical protein